MNIKNLRVLVVVAIAVGIAFTLAWLSPQTPAPVPVQLTDSRVTIVQNHYGITGTLKSSVRERIAVNATTGKILTVRRLVHPDRDMDDTNSELRDLADGTVTRWFRSLGLKNTTRHAGMTRSETEAFWASQGCGTFPMEDWNSENNLVTVLGETTLQPWNIKAYGAEVQESMEWREIESPNPPLYTTRTFYRAPQFGCAEVRLKSTATLKDGSQVLTSEKDIVAYSPADSGDAQFEAPADFREVSRQTMMREIRARDSRM